MPTLLQINSGVNIGSTGRIAEQIGQFAISKGWVSYIAYGRKSNLSISRTIKIGNKFDFISHVFLTRLFDKHGLGSIWATKILIKKIKLINPDIIHLHNIHGYYINYKVLFEFLSRSNIPVVWTLHDCWAFTGHCSYFSNINCVKWTDLCNQCPKKKYYPTSLFFDLSEVNYLLKRKLFNSVNRMIIVPVSFWLNGLISHSYLSNFPLRVINNGIDLTLFHPITSYSEIRRKYDITQRSILIGVANVWHVGKGLHDYYKLSELLPDEYIIVLVGLTKKQINTLPSKIKGIEKTESIIELASLYSASDIVLNLSYQETFGMTTVEGFACGTPGIVYNSTASPELITPETGIIVEPGNIKHVLHAIEDIISKGKDYYSSNCRRRAVEFYNKDKQYEQYLQLYEELITT